MKEYSSESYAVKAAESLAGAGSEMANARYNNCANRCYYACFQAAVAALVQEGVHPTREQWGHDFVQAQFIGILINRRKRFGTDLRGTLERAYALRQVADYQEQQVGETQANRAVQRTQQFVESVLGGGRR